MKIFLKCMFVAAIGLCLLSGSTEADAVKKSTKRKSTTTSSSSKGSSTSRTICLTYHETNLGQHDVYISLYPSGIANEVTYSNFGNGKNLSGNVNGTWKKNYRIIGNGTKQYYYEINIDGSTGYYDPTSKLLYYSYSAFSSSATGRAFKVTETIK